MRDDRRKPSAARDRGFTGVVARIQIELRGLAQEPVGPAVAGEGRLESGHPLRRAVHSHVDHGVGIEIPGDPTVEAEVLMMRRFFAVKDQAHGVTLDANSGLHADEHVAEADPTHEDGVTPRRSDVSGEVAPSGVHALPFVADGHGPEPLTVEGKGGLPRPRLVRVAVFRLRWRRRPRSAPRSGVGGLVEQAVEGLGGLGELSRVITLGSEPLQ